MVERCGSLSNISPILEGNDGIGEYNGIREKIPYLKDLGVNLLWLNPIYESPMVDNRHIFLIIIK